MSNNKAFENALKGNDLLAIRSIEKSDLHNHYVFGASRTLINEEYNINIPKLDKRLSTINEMNEIFTHKFFSLTLISDYSSKK